MELHNVDLNKVVTFLAIADAGAVTSSSRKLGLTRSAVSHSLRALETALGVRLFHRVGKTLVLTSEGRLLRRAAGEMRDRLDPALDEVLGLGKEVRGSVRVGLFVGFSRGLLADAVQLFVERHPQAHVRVAFGPQPWLVEQLVSGALDLTLSLRPTRDLSFHIQSERLWERPLMLALRGAGRAPRSFAQISRLPIVDYYQKDPLIDRWTRHHCQRQVVPRERIRAFAASTDLALELVLRGTGAAVLPNDLVEPLRRTGQLTVISGSKRPLLDQVFLNELAGAKRGRAATAFREILRARVARTGEI
jgi:DNA-binding transcriptional LysR family regulator